MSLSEQKKNIVNDRKRLFVKIFMQSYVIKYLFGFENWIELKYKKNNVVLLMLLSVQIVSLHFSACITWQFEEGKTEAKKIPPQ